MSNPDLDEIFFNKNTGQGAGSGASPSGGGFAFKIGAPAQPAAHHLQIKRQSSPVENLLNLPMTVEP